MSPYASELAHARLDALRALIDALDAAEDPAEKRRCAVAILKAPDPCEIDDSIELVDDDEGDENDADHEDEPPDAQQTPSVNERAATSAHPRLAAPDNRSAPPSSQLPPAEAPTAHPSTNHDIQSRLTNALSSRPAHPNPPP